MQTIEPRKVDPWMKYWKDKMRAWRYMHPTVYHSYYMHMLCELHDLKGVHEASLESWKKIIASPSKQEAHRFFKYIRDNIRDVLVEAETRRVADEKGSPGSNEWFFKVTSPEIVEEFSKKERVRNAVRKHRQIKPPATAANVRRADNLRLVKEAYHPLKAHGQKEKTVKVFKDLMIEASRPFSRKEKPGAEEALVKRILTYIDSLKNTSQWQKNDGAYLPGMGNFLESRAWEYGKATSESSAPTQQDQDIEALIGG